MEVLFAFAVVLLPLILSILAYRRAGEVAEKLRRLEDEWRWSQAERERSGTVVVAPATPEQPPVTPAAPPPPSSTQRVAPPQRPAQRASVRSGGGLEALLGGRVAAFVGIAAILFGVVFFVGYAIHHGWIGPATRILLGLATGLALLALGWSAERRGRGLGVLARVLTGGGAALLFFSVFAAHGFYALIPPWLATVGLALTALAALLLAAAYRSRAVALLGVVGAFLTPLLIGGEIDRGVFPLAYVAAINLSVLLLAWRRNWQSLYNAAFAFTALYMTLWLFRELDRRAASMWPIGLAFSLVFYAEYVGLALVKLTRSRAARDRQLDVSRLLTAGLLLLVAVHSILDRADRRDWLAISFGLLSVVHFLLVRFSWRHLSSYRAEVLVLLAAGVTFATLAIPVQLDGAWVSLGWVVEGIVLSALAVRFGITPFATAGPMIGMVGLARALFYDSVTGSATDRLFLNVRFVVQSVAALGLGLQAQLLAPLRRELDSTSRWTSLLWLGLCIGLVSSVWNDGVRLLDLEHPWAWLPAIALLLPCAALLAWIGQREDSLELTTAGNLALCLVPVGLVLFVFGIAFDAYDARAAHFGNSILLLSAALLAAVLWSSARLPGADSGQFPRRALLAVLCALALIFIVTREIDRAATDWRNTAITLWWGSCALGLILLGLRRRKRYLRVTALFLFGVTIAKTFLVDLADLNGLVRVAVFLGVGVILLVLSWIYQRSVAKSGERDSA